MVAGTVKNDRGWGGQGKDETGSKYCLKERHLDCRSPQRIVHLGNKQVRQRSSKRSCRLTFATLPPTTVTLPVARAGCSLRSDRRPLSSIVSVPVPARHAIPSNWGLVSPCPQQ